MGTTRFGLTFPLNTERFDIIGISIGAGVFLLSLSRSMQQFLYFLPLPHQQRSFRPIFFIIVFAFIIALLQIGHVNSLLGHGPHALSPLRGSHKVNAKSKAREKSTRANTNNQKYPIVSAINPPSSGIK